jgi:hypothetical protein
VARNVNHFYEPDWRASLQEIAEFLAGEQADVADDRVLATVLFTDIVDSTRRAAEMDEAAFAPGGTDFVKDTSQDSTLEVVVGRPRLPAPRLRGGTRDFAGHPRFTQGIYSAWQYARSFRGE